MLKMVYMDQVWSRNIATLYLLIDTFYLLIEETCPRN